MFQFLQETQPDHASEQYLHQPGLVKVVDQGFVQRDAFRDLGGFLQFCIALFVPLKIEGQGFQAAGRLHQPHFYQKCKEELPAVVILSKDYALFGCQGDLADIVQFFLPDGDLFNLDEPAVLGGRLP